MPGEVFRGVEPVKTLACWIGTTIREGKEEKKTHEGP